MTERDTRFRTFLWEIVKMPVTIARWVNHDSDIVGIVAGLLMFVSGMFSAIAHPASAAPISVRLLLFTWGLFGMLWCLYICWRIKYD